MAAREHNGIGVSEDILRRVLTMLAPLQLATCTKFVCVRWHTVTEEVLRETRRAIGGLRIEVEHGREHVVRVRGQNGRQQEKCVIPRLMRQNPGVLSPRSRGDICCGRKIGEVAVVLEEDSCVHLLRTCKRGYLKYGNMIPLKNIRPVGVAYIKEDDSYIIADTASPALVVMRHDGLILKKVPLPWTCTSMTVVRRSDDQKLVAFLTCENAEFEPEPLVDRSQMNLADLANPFPLRQAGSLISVEISTENVAVLLESSLNRPFGCRLDESMPNEAIVFSHFATPSQRAISRFYYAGPRAGELSRLGSRASDTWHILTCSDGSINEWSFQAFQASQWLKV